MDTEVHKDEKLLFREEVFQIVSCAIEVLNKPGRGLIEKPYENALVVECGLREIPFRQQPAFERGWMLNYLRISKLRVGVILHFKRGKLEWARVVL
jgi:hypothetical protein